MSGPAIAVPTTQAGKLSDPGHPCAATYASFESCPPCPLSEVCYANGGQTAWTMKRLDKAAKGMRPVEIAEREAAKIDAMEAHGQPLRLHVGGDCRTDPAARRVGAASKRWRRRGGGKVFTFSHGWRWVARSSWGSAVSVLASVERVADIATARARGYAAAITVATPEEVARVPGGFRCPEQTGKVASCAACLICTRGASLLETKKPVVFVAHGMRVRKARELLRGWV